MMHPQKTIVARTANGCLRVTLTTMVLGWNRNRSAVEKLTHVKAACKLWRVGIASKPLGTNPKNPTKKTP